MTKFVVITWAKNLDETTHYKEGQQMGRKCVIDCITWREAQRMADMLQRGLEVMNMQDGASRAAIAAIQSWDVMGRPCYLNPQDIKHVLDEDTRDGRLSVTKDHEYMKAQT